MPVRIRLSRGGAKKRPFYRIVVADSRRARDGKFIDQVGTYNPMLNKDNPERVKIDIEKAKEWIIKGAQPSDRVKLFLSTMGVGDKPIITEKTKQHLPKKKTLEKLAAAKKAEEAPKIVAEKPATEAADPAADAPAKAKAPAKAPEDAPAEVKEEAPAKAKAPADAPAEVKEEAPTKAEAPAEEKTPKA